MISRQYQVCWFQMSTIISVYEVRSPALLPQYLGIGVLVQLALNPEIVVTQNAGQASS